MSDEKDLSTLDSDVRNHLESLLRDPSKLDGLDVSFLFTKLDSLLFNDVLHELVKKYKEINNGNLPKLDLVFVIDDLGSDNDRKKATLRRLKALLEKSNGGVSSIVVKGVDREAVVGLEPNVFASGVDFQPL